MNNSKSGNFSFFNIPSNNNLPEFVNNTSLQDINTLNFIPNSSNSNLENFHNPVTPFNEHQEESLAQRIATQPTIASSKKKKSGCTCKKTFCLKMYCECFSSGKNCSEDCNCHNCRNTEQFKEEIQKAKHSVRQGGLKSCSLSEKRCNCKKSHCLKKYCECYNSGVGCSQACKCTDCENIYKQPPKEEKQELQYQEKKELLNLNPEYVTKRQLPEISYRQSLKSIDDLEKYYN